MMISRIIQRYQRAPFFWIALGCDSVFLMALLFQQTLWPEACLLCLIQRWSWLLLGILCHIKHWRPQTLLTFGIIPILLINLMSAIRQLYLQHINIQAQCLPDFWFFWETGRWSEGLKNLLAEPCSQSPLIFGWISLAALNSILIAIASILLYQATKKHEPALYHP